MLVWDAMCMDTLAPSHSALAIREAGAVAASAEQRKRTKYLHLETTHHFVPVAVETLSPIGEEGRAFLKELRRRIAATCFEPFSYQYLLQRVAVAIQRGNAAAVLGTISRGGGLG